MGILSKPRKGDLVGAPKRASSDISNQRAQQIKTRSQSGFKGEVKNDHGLPLGGSEILQTKNANEPGPKFRPAKYESGSKGIKVKKGNTKAVQYLKDNH